MSILPLTTRIDANLGYACNNDCLFCYFKERKRTRNSISTQQAKRLFSRIKRLGIETLEITGGEVTIRDDIIELIAFAKRDLRFKKITVITNGSRFCDEEFTASASAAGVDDVLISLHGSSARLHDKLVGRGGAYDNAVEAINNVIRAGISCRTNTVVTAYNYREASNIAALIYSLGVRKVNYIYFSPLDDAANVETDLWVRYSDTASHIRAMLSLYKDKFKAISIKVFPFCLLGGYEEYITNFFQNIYDPYEWDFYNRVRIRRNMLQRDLAVAAGLLLFMDIRRILQIGFRKSCYESIVRVQSFRECVKAHVCRRCKYDYICPGIWKSYAQRFGMNELNPVLGKKIKDLDFCLRKRFSDYPIEPYA
ncbi:MAG: radical SAM protein [Candidatus Omnitrophica bacterium]|nr:radical SAM protein [Candidatus Omnitrophota bacterium]